MLASEKTEPASAVHASPAEQGRLQLLTLLERTDWNIAEVARLLGVTRDRLHAAAQLRDRAAPRAEALQEDARGRMSDLQLLVAHLVKPGSSPCWLGMVVRGRIGLCWSFAAYVLAILVGNTLVTLSPERFYTPAFWVLKQGVRRAQDGDRESSWRGGPSAFPATWQSVRAVLLALLAASTLSLAWLTPGTSYDTLWSGSRASLRPRSGCSPRPRVVVFYQVPIGEGQRAIMSGWRSTCWCS